MNASKESAESAISSLGTFAKAVSFQASSASRPKVAATSVIWPDSGVQ